MPRFAQTRFIAAVIGLAAGLAVTLGAQPAQAIHIELRPGDSGIAAIGEPLVIIGVVEQGDVPAGGNFTHTFNFGFNLGATPGLAGVTATPAFLEIGGQAFAGFDAFEGFVTGPGIMGQIDLDRDAAAQIPRINRIATPDFAVMDTMGQTPYTLTIMGSLLPGVLIGNYTGNIAVTPLPGAALVLLSALGGLVAVRRYRSQGAAAA